MIFLLKQCILFFSVLNLMIDWQLQTSVVFLIFNRPDTVVRVFKEIRCASPQKLIVVADMPRPDKQGEAEKLIQLTGYESKQIFKLLS
jgi:hypothetical protein